VGAEERFGDLGGWWAGVVVSVVFLIFLKKSKGQWRRGRERERKAVEF
jgi:hypothetical protein